MPLTSPRGLSGTVQTGSESTYGSRNWAGSRMGELVNLSFLTLKLPSGATGGRQEWDSTERQVSSAGTSAGLGTVHRGGRHCGLPNLKQHIAND